MGAVHRGRDRARPDLVQHVAAPGLVQERKADVNDALPRATGPRSYPGAARASPGSSARPRSTSPAARSGEGRPPDRQARPEEPE
jgi:hypothetical protein